MSHLVDTCPAEEELSALLDGDLESPRKNEVASHLESCPDCQKLVGELEALKSELPSLAQIEPQANMLPAIMAEYRAASEPKGFEFLRRLWALPAAAVFGAALVLVVMWFMGSSGPAPQEQSPKPVSALDSVMKAENIYSTAILDLERALESHKSSYTPEVRTVLDKGLADMQKVIEKCRAAVRSSPDDPAVHQAVLAAYQQKVDFLSELVGESI